MYQQVALVVVAGFRNLLCYRDFFVNPWMGHAEIIVGNFSASVFGTRELVARNM